MNNGVLGKRIKHKGIVYHIYHKEQDKSQVHLNLEIEKQMESSGTTYASKGVDQYL
jgi:hypothetical protein